MKVNTNLAKQRKNFFGEISNNQTPKELAEEYMKDTSIHGMRYVVKDGSALWERFCWIIAIVVCTTFAGVNVNFVWEKFKTSPIRTIVDTTNYPLYKLPFPAVTICPSIRVRKREGIKLLSRYLKIKDLNETTETKFWNIMSAISLTQFPFYYRIEKHYNELGDILYMFDEFNISQFVLQAMPTCEEVFNECFWYGLQQPCCDIFTFQRTELGYCFSFNSLTADIRQHCTPWHDLNFGELKISPSVIQNFSGCTLRRNTGAGTTTGLELFMKSSIDEDSLGSGQRDPKGFRIYVHDPSDWPEASKGIFISENNNTVFTVKISAAITVSTDAIRELQLDERHCCFPEERSLTFFPHYTLESCYVECRMKHIIKECHCTPYFFDASVANVPICKLKDLICLAKVNTQLRSFSPPVGTPGFEKGWSNMVNCSLCKPMCHETLYSIDTTMSENINELALRSAGYIDIYYKDLGAVRYTRDFAFGWMQLLVSFGGIVGLFLGVSILSAVEFFYYVIKIILNILIQKGKRTELNSDSKHEKQKSHAWNIDKRIETETHLKPFVVDQHNFNNWHSEDI